MNEVEHDIKNYQAEVYRYQSKSKAEFNNCFIYFKERKNSSCMTYLRKPFMLFHIPAPLKVDAVDSGMTSLRDIRLFRPRYDVIT